MAEVVVLATAGAGGDFHPLMAVILGLRERGHRVIVIGDHASVDVARDNGIEATGLDPRHDLGPLLVQAVRDTQMLPHPAQGDLVLERLATWSSDAAVPVRRVLAQRRPDLVLTSLFGVAIARAACASMAIPWAIINSTFYVGPNSPRPLEADLGARAVPLFRYLVGELEPAALVLHATDPHFDFDYTGLPPRHHYVGPLFWEVDSEPPSYLSQPGDPWVLVTISSQLQDDFQIAQHALLCLAPYPVRVLLTLGPGHSVGELGEVPGNIHVEQYVSHAAVLERGRLLVSHAGHGSVMKALWHGVPMVLIPWGRDQPGVAARAERLGTAVLVQRDQLQASVLAEAIGEALSPPYQARAREVAQSLRALDPVGKACDFIEELL